MSGKRQKDPEFPKIASAFLRELRETSGDVIHELSFREKIPLKHIYDGHVQGAFQLLHMALLARRTLTGKAPPLSPSGPVARIQERTEMMKEVMDLVGDELEAVDPYHEYSVLVIKRARGSKTIL